MIWLGVFSVNLNPPEEKNVVVTQAVFLGDFLKKAYLSKPLGSLHTGSENKPVAFMEKKHQITGILPERLLKEDSRSSFIYEASNSKPRDLARNTLDKRYTFSPDVSKRPPLDIEGPLSKRDVLFLPDKPEIPKWHKDKGSFNIKSKLYVDNRGRVVFIEQLASSGYLDIDLLAKKYLSKIRFSQDSALTEDEREWGIINVKIEAIND
jgi:hypothetical protein